MDSDLVNLYTSDSPEDSKPEAFPYYLDYTGQECLEIALQNLGMVVIPGYNLLLRNNKKDSWLDLHVSLRAQSVNNGDMIIVLPTFFDMPIDTASTSNYYSSALFNSQFESDNTFFNKSMESLGNSLLTPSFFTNDMPIPPSELDTDDLNNPSPLLSTSFNLSDALEPIPALQMPIEDSGPIKIEAINADDIEEMSDSESSSSANRKTLLSDQSKPLAPSSYTFDSDGELSKLQPLDKTDQTTSEDLPELPDLLPPVELLPNELISFPAPKEIQLKDPSEFPTIDAETPSSPLILNLPPPSILQQNEIDNLPPPLELKEEDFNNLPPIPTMNSISPTTLQIPTPPSSNLALDMLNPLQAPPLPLNDLSSLPNPLEFPPASSSRNSARHRSSRKNSFNTTKEDISSKEFPTINRSASDAGFLLGSLDKTSSPVSSSMPSETESDTEDTNRIDLYNELDFQSNNFGSFRNFDELEKPVKKEITGKPISLVTYDGFKKGGTAFEYDDHSSFHDLLEEALKNIKRKREGRYTILINRSGQKDIMRPNQYLEEFSPSPNDSIHIFKCDQTINIQSTNFPPASITLDISKPVDDLLADIGSYYDYEAYLTYGLFTTEKATNQSLNGQLTLIEQTKSYRNLFFARKYFIFSLEDLYTIESATIAINDAMSQLPKDKVYLKEEDAAKVLLFYAVATAPDSTKVDYTRYCDKNNTYLPASCQSMKLTSKVKQMSKAYKKMDKFNAIRTLLRFLRKQPGFGCYNFFNNIVETKYNDRKVQHRIIIQVAPYCLRFIRPGTSVLEERISYSKIISKDLLGNRLQLKFSYGSERGKYTIIGHDAKQIKELMEECIMITRKIQYKRARERAARYGGSVINLIDDRDKVELNAAFTFSDPNPKKLNYDLKMAGDIVLQYTEQNLGIPHSSDNVIILQVFKQTFQWIKATTLLTMLNVQNNMTIYLLRNNRPIEFVFTDDHTTKIVIDITKPIEELVDLVFHQQKMQPILGYTFFSLEDPANPRPLDSRFTIPEVCKNWDRLLFKRRFYVISGEVLSNAFAAHSTLNDCKEFFLKGTCVATEDDIINLAILAYYGNADDPSHVPNIQHFDWSTIAPKGFKVTKKFQQKFIDRIRKSKPMDPFSAARSYLGKVRNLKGFGVEKFWATYLDLNAQRENTKEKEQVIDVLLCIGPLRITIFDAQNKGKDMIQNIAYRHIASFESLGHRLIIKFLNPQGTISSFELKISNISTALMIMNYNIKIIRDLMLARQRKKQREEEENAKRLNGGYIDENGVIRSRMIDFYVSKDLEKSTGLPKIWLELERNGQEVLEILTPLLKLDRATQWCILMRLVRQEWKWIYPLDVALETANPERFSILYVLVANPIIHVDFSMNRSKDIQLPIYNTVSQLVPIVTKELKLNSSIGFTLFLVKDNEQIPLDATISLPEQTIVYDRLFFKRRFFVISKFDMDDPDMLYQLFCDVRDLVKSGKIEMSSEHALQLMYFEIKAENYVKLTKTQIPKDPKPFLPIGMKPKENVQKYMLKMLDEHPVESNRDALIEYIRIARSLPTFGTERYDVILVEEKKDAVERTPAIVYVGPNKVSIRDEDDKKNLYIVPYKTFLGTDFTDSEMSLRYRNQEIIQQPEEIHLESELSPKISGLILSYLEVYNQILLKRIETNDSTQPNDRIDLLTVYGYNIERTIKATYDARWTGAKVIETAVRVLGLDPEGRYVCLLRQSKKDFAWLDDDAVLGTLNPQSGLYIHIYHEYMPVHITTPITNYTRFMYLNVQREARQLIEEIAFKMFIDNPTGYSLYYEELGNLIPIDLRKPIAYQVIDFSRLLFKRRFFVYTKADIISPIHSPMIYTDVKYRVLQIEDQITTKQALNLAAFQLIVESESMQKLRKNPLPADLSFFFPRNMDIKPEFRENLKAALNQKSSTTITKDRAMAQYISIASKIKYFACEIFDCYDFKGAEGKFLSKQKKRSLKIAIGPNSFIIFETQTDKEVIFCPHSSIISIKCIKNNVIIKTTNQSKDDGKTIINRIVLISDKAKDISGVLLNYREIVIPELNKRYGIQKKPEMIPSMAALVDPIRLTEGGVKVQLSRQLEHPNPPTFTLTKKFTCDEAITVGLFDLVYPRKGEYMILTIPQRKRIDNQYTWLSSQDNLKKANLVEDSRVAFVQEMPSVQVITEKLHIKEISVRLRSKIFDLCTQLVKEFGLGSNLGFTLYEFWNEKQRPLDFLFNIPETEENYIEVVLRRRFFLFTRELLEDPLTLKSGYRSVKNQVLSGTMQIPEETAAELAIYSLYYFAKQPQDVLTFVSNTNEQNLQPLLPANIKATPAMLKKFNAAASIIPQLDQRAAAMKYIIAANNCVGFGMEEYPCYYTEINNLTMAHIEAIIRLCPYYVSCVLDNKNQTEVARFTWNSIIEYSRTGIITKVQYQNENSMFINIELESEEYCREIFSFINDILDLFSKGDFSDLGNLADQTNDDFNYDDLHIEIDVSTDFRYDDIGSFQTIQRENEFDFAFGDTNTGIIRNADDDYLQQTLTDNWKWRTTENGLMISRGLDLVDDIDRNLKFDELDSNGNDLTRRMNNIDDSISRTQFDDDMQNRFKPVDDGLQSLRQSLIDKSRDSQQPQIVTILDNLFTFKNYLNDRKDQIIVQGSDQLNDFDEDQNPNEPLAFNLMQLSEIMENVIKQLNSIQESTLPGNLNDEISLIISSLLSQSQNATTLSGNLLKTRDIGVLPQLITPLLSDIKVQELQLKDLSARSKDMGNDTENLDDLLQTLNKLITTLEKNPALEATNAPKSRYVLMPGDVRGLPTLLDDLKLTNEQLNALQNSTEDLKPLETSLLFTSNCLTQSIPVLDSRIKQLQFNPLNDIARCDTLQNLDDVLNSLDNLRSNLSTQDQPENKLLLQLNDSIFKDINGLRKELQKISTINITTSNVQAIETALNNLLNRYQLLSNQIKNDIHNENPTLDDSALKTIRESRFLTSGLLNQLIQTPTSGEVIAKLQKVIIDLSNKLPVIKEFADLTEKHGKDILYPVIVESLEANIKDALMEDPPKEDITQASHIAKYRQVQLDTGKLLNTLKTSMESPVLRSNPELAERTSTLYSKMVPNYIKQIELRKSIQAHPYDPESLQKAVAHLDDLQTLSNKLQTVSSQIPDPTSNILLGNQLNLLLKDIKLADASLKAAPLGTFHEPPSQDLIDKIDRLLNGFTNFLAPQIEQLEMISESPLTTELKNKLKTLLPIVPKYINAGKAQSNEFFSMTPGINDLITNMKDDIDQIYQLSPSKEYIYPLLTIFQELMEGTVPTTETAFRYLSNTIPAITDFTSLLKKLLDTPNLSEDAKLLLTNFQNKGIELDVNLVQSVSTRDPNTLNHDKNMLLNMRTTISQLPPYIRASLGQKDFSDLIQSISNLTTRANYAIAAIRLLPTEDKLEIDESKFKKISPDDELDESIPIVFGQCQGMSNHLTQLINYEPLKTKKATLNLLNHMKDTYDPLNEYSPDKSHQDLLTILNQLSESKIFLKESTQLIAPVAGDPNLINCERIRMDNISTLIRALQQPHLTAEKSTALVKELKPQLEIIEPIMLQIKSSKETTFSDDLKKLLDQYSDLIQLSNQNINTDRKVEQQKIVDNLYRDTGVILPLLLETDDYDDLQNKISTLYDSCAKYTTLRIQPIRFTTPLQVKKQLIPEQATTIIKKTIEEIGSDTTALSPDLANGLMDIMNTLKSSPESIPKYMTHSSQILLPSLTTRNLLFAPTAIRTATSALTDTQDIFDLLEQLTIQCARRAAIQLSFAQQPFNEIEAEFVNNPDSFSEQQRFWIAHSSKALKASDTSLLIQCPSIPTFVFDYVSMHRILNNLILLSESLNKRVSIQNPTKNYEDWLFQSDMAAAALFMAHLDRIVTTCDDILSENPGKVSYAVKEFVRKVANILKEIDRCIYYNASSLSQLAQVYLDFSSTMFPELRTTFPEDKTKPITSSIDSLQKFKPVIQYWANLFNNMDEFQFITLVQSSALPVLARTAEIPTNQLISSIPEIVALDAAPCNSSISKINAVVKAAENQKISNADKLEGNAQKAARIAYGTIARPPYTDVNVEKELGRINKTTSSLVEKLLKYHPYDYYQLPTDTIYQREETELDEIDDPKVKDYLKEIKKYLQTLEEMTLEGTLREDLHVIERVSTILDSDEQTNYPDLDDPILLLTDCNTRGILPIDTIKTNTSDDIEDLDPNEDKLNLVSSTFLANSLFEEMQHAFLIQRLSFLKLQQMLEFPVVVTRIDQLQKEGIYHINKDDVPASFDFIVKQFDKLPEPKELKDIQKNYVPDQIITQQYMLSKLIRDEQLSQADSSKFTKRFVKALENLLNIAIEQLKTSTPKYYSNTELRSMMARSFGQIDLINQLLMLIQQIVEYYPQILKFAQSPEGQETIQSMLSIDQIGAEQSRISQDIQLISKPHLLEASLKSYSPENIIVKMRILLNLLNVITSESNENLMTRNINPTPADILHYAIGEQNKTIQSVSSTTSIIDTVLITKAQQFILNQTLRTTLLCMLLNAQTYQVLNNPEAPAVAHLIEQKRMNLSNDDIVKYTETITTQVLTPNPDLIKDIRMIPKQDLIPQQLMLDQLASLIGAGAVNLKLNLKASLHATIRGVQETNIAEMSSNNEAFSGIEPLNLPQYSLDSQLLLNHHRTKLRNLDAIRQTIIKLETRFPSLRTSNGKVSRQDYDDIRLAEIRSTAANLVTKFLLADPSLQQIYDNMIEKDGEIIHAILLAEEKLIAADEPLRLSQYNLLANQIFDEETTKQLLYEQEMYNANKTENKIEIPTIQQIDLEIGQTDRSVTATRLLGIIANLCRRRSELYPKVTQKTSVDISLLTEKKLSKLILSIKEQFESGDDLPLFLKPLNSDQLLIQELLLQHLSEQLMNDNFLQSCSSLLDEARREDAHKLIPQLLDILLRDVTTNPNVLMTVHNSTFSELVHTCNVVPYQVAKLLLYNALITNIKTNITANDLAIDNDNEMLLKPFDQKELIPIHELLRVSLSLRAGNDEILVSNNFDDDQQLRQLVATTKLANQIKPAFFSLPAQEKTKIDFDLSSNSIRQIANPLLAEKQDQQRLTLLIQSLPADDELQQKLIQMVKSVLTIAPTMFNLPSYESLNLLLSLTRKSIALLNQLYQLDKVDYFPDQLNGLIATAPQLISVLIASRKDLPEMITIKPVELLEKIANLSIDCISINDEVTNEDYRYTLITLLDNLKQLEAVLEPKATSEIQKERKLDTYATMAKSINLLQINQLTYHFTDFNVSTVIAKSEGDKQNEELVEEASKLQQAITDCYKVCQPTVTDSNQKEELGKFRTDLVDIITNNTRNPYELIRSLNTLSEVRDAINTCKDTIDVSLEKYVTAVHGSNDFLSKSEFNKLLDAILIAQAATLRGFQIENKPNITFYLESLTMFSSSFSNLSSIADTKQQGTKPSATIRRTIRAINRTISQLSDELSYAELEDEMKRSGKKKRHKKKSKKDKEETVEESESPQQDQKLIDNCKLDFIKCLTETSLFVQCTGSSYASSRLPETRAQFVQNEQENFDKLNLLLKDSTINLNKLNTDRKASDAFNNNMKSLQDSLTLFNNASMKIDNDIGDVTSTLIQLNKNLSDAAESSIQLTDVAPLVPDILNADKLIKNFVLPLVPNDMMNMKIQDAVDPLEQMIESYQGKIDSVFTLFNNQNGQSFVNNNSAAKKMNKAADELHDVLEQFLRVSSLLLDVESRNGLTEGATIITAQFNSLIQMLRKKFLLKSNEWDEEKEKVSKSISKELEKALKLTLKAKETDIKEQHRSSLSNRLKLSIEKLLKAQGALHILLERSVNKTRQMMQQEEITSIALNREWSMRITELALNYATVTLNCMIPYIDSPEDLSKLDTLVSFADSLANECNNTYDQASELANNDSNDIESGLQAILKVLNELSNSFIKNGGEGTSEEKSLKANLQFNNNLGDSLAKSIQASIESKNSLSKLTLGKEIQDDQLKQARMKSLSEPVRSVKRQPHVKDELIKRFQLESKVTEARMRLKIAEKILSKM